VRDEDKWPAMHAYRKAVQHGDALPIRCPDCQGELVPVVDTDTLPALKCLACRAVFEPGLHVWDQIALAIWEINERNQNGH
jgi:uncharacterized protein with PIN domain